MWMRKSWKNLKNRATLDEAALCNCFFANLPAWFFTLSVNLQLDDAEPILALAPESDVAGGSVQIGQRQEQLVLFAIVFAPSITLLLFSFQLPSAAITRRTTSCTSASVAPTVAEDEDEQLAQEPLQLDLPQVLQAA